MVYSKICPKCFWEFPKFLLNMLFMLPIMLGLCSIMNNTDVKFHCLNVLLEYLQYESRSMILSMHFSTFWMFLYNVFLYWHIWQKPTQVYEEFLAKWGFNHINSSLYHSQHNGKAEGKVNIPKNMLKRVTQDNLDMSLAILTWCNAPTEGGHYSWVQKLQQRRMHTQLPTAGELLKSEISKGIENEIHSIYRRQKAKQQCEKTGKNSHLWH